MKYVFFGTPEFARIVLAGLIKVNMPPVAVICNPDRPAGRERVNTPPPTKLLAQENGLEVYQPADKGELLNLASKLAERADFGLLAAYGVIIPRRVIDSFRLGIIGVHPSLLPKYRGPSPIQSAILGGEDKTGTTLFMMDTGVDTGPVLIQREVEIKGAYYEDLLRTLAQASVNALLETLPSFVDGRVVTTDQNDEGATYTKLFETSDAEISQRELEEAVKGDRVAAFKIWRLIRALNPEPGAFTLLDGKRTKLLRARVEDERLVLEKIQREGKKPQPFTQN
jgi:methionyl-tRNA formyltransferase